MLGRFGHRLFSAVHGLIGFCSVRWYFLCFDICPKNNLIYVVLLLVTLHCFVWFLKSYGEILVVASVPNGWSKNFCVMWYVILQYNLVNTTLVNTKTKNPDYVKWFDVPLHWFCILITQNPGNTNWTMWPHCSTKNKGKNLKKKNKTNIKNKQTKTNKQTKKKKAKFWKYTSRFILTSYVCLI